MNRQHGAPLRLLPLCIQQGLSIVLALVVTLIGGQQFLRWEHSQQPDAGIAPTLHIAPPRSSAVSSHLPDATSRRMMDIDQARPEFKGPPQERWVF
ncbi:hypothetical protein D3C76_1508920 [compost metagenome]